MRQNHIQGICAVDEPDFPLLRDLGVKYVRMGAGFPFADRTLKTISPRFQDNLARLRRYTDEGFKVLQGTFIPGSCRYDPQSHQTRWTPAFPSWVGSHEDERFYEILETSVDYVVRATRGTVDLWQVANEPDNPVFCGPLNDQQMNRFLLTIARAIKRVVPSARTGINIAVLNEHARAMVQSLYRSAGSPMDYIGIDGYFGSWEAGGPEKWPGYITEAHEITGAPVIINEWGYSSLQAGPITDDPLRKKYYIQEVCRNKAWSHHWGGGHSPEVQAQFMQQCIAIFADHPHCVGNFIFRWNDTPTCWQCGQPLCPAETAWGIVSSDNQPKPAYHALKARIHSLFGDPDREAK